MVILIKVIMDNIQLLFKGPSFINQEYNSVIKINYISNYIVIMEYEINYYLYWQLLHYHYNSFLILFFLDFWFFLKILALKLRFLIFFHCFLKYYFFKFQKYNYRFIKKYIFLL